MGRKEDRSLIINYDINFTTSYSQLFILKHKNSYFIIEACNTVRRVIRKKISLRTIRKVLEYRKGSNLDKNRSPLYYPYTDFHIFIFEYSDPLFAEAFDSNKKEVIREWIDQEIRRQKENEPTSY